MARRRSRQRSRSSRRARFISWSLIVVAAGSLGAHFGTAGRSIGAIWASIHSNSLVGLQSLVEKRLDPDPEAPTLYFDYVLPVLETPFWLTVAILAFALAIIGFLMQLVRGRGDGGGLDD